MSQSIQNSPKKIVILGSTGSVGRQALEIIQQFPRLFQAVGLSANTNVQVILAQIKQFRPHAVAMSDEKSALELKEKLKKAGANFSRIKVCAGDAGLEELAALEKADLVLTSVVGSCGILPTLAAVKAGKTIGLANKETLVAAGEIITAAARRHQAPIIPVDSEHSAIFQCLMGESAAPIENLFVSCTGGPFWKTPPAQLKNVTRKQALKHVWNMGGKITIDSATLMNKGFEVIEAHWLFNLPYEKIQVLVHPQSLVHSLVELSDGCIKAQLGQPSMKVPIQLAFTYPQRLANPANPRLKLTQNVGLRQLNQMNFEKPNLNKFPCLKYAYEAGKAGGTFPTVLNAANEIAVEAFLKNKIPYLDIARVIRQALNQHQPIKNPSLDDILAIDQEVKTMVRKKLFS